jgi:hypothetical protein
MTTTLHSVHKSRIRILFVFIILFLFVLLSNSLRAERSPDRCFHLDPQIETNQPTLVIPSKIEEHRQSITFILGEDDDPQNPYYTQSTNYYRNNPDGKTEYLVTTCRSLLEVRNYLAKNKPSNLQAWGLINLVSHGNQWLGLSVKVTPNSKRATPDRILENVENGNLQELPDSLVDSNTEIFIHGCGIGNNPEILKAIGLAFGGKDNFPLVKASKLFEYYSTKEENGIISETQRYLAQTWNVYYKMGEKPGVDTLLQLFSSKYPGSKIDFTTSLNREEPRWSGDMYSYTFEVPVKFTIKKSDIDTLPDLTKKANLEIWASQQQEIKNMLQKIEIPADKFNWSVTNVYIKDEKGNKSPALWIKGYCTVHCVIMPLTGCNDEQDNSAAEIAGYYSLN